MKRALEYLAPAAVIFALAGLGLRPTWVSAAAFLTAVLFMAAEQALSELRSGALAKQSLAKSTAEYAAEVAGLREETKRAVDAVKAATSAQTMAKRGF